MPKFQTNLINALFIAAVIIPLAISVATPTWRLLMIEAAAAALSLKIIYLIHSQMKVNHFEFWILSSLEWRINEMMVTLRGIKKKL